ADPAHIERVLRDLVTEETQTIRLAPDISRLSAGERMAVDKLIEAIWEQIHKLNLLLVPEDISKTFANADGSRTPDFADTSRRCRILTCVSRTSRSIEVMMQVHWVDCHYTRIDALKGQRPDRRPPEHKKMVMAEACTNFG
ncbi:MAG: hypothetical protein M1823_008428, partial [Watsoniomyces obsoletus]